MLRNSRTAFAVAMHAILRCRRRQKTGRLHPLLPSTSILLPALLLQTQKRALAPFAWRDQSRTADPHGMQPAIEVARPEIEEFV